MMPAVARDLPSRARNKWRRLLVHHAGQRRFDLSTRVPYISFTFDDYPRSALLEGGRILEAHGVRGTYFISLNLAGGDSPSGTVATPDDVVATLEAGHEVGCHTYAHLDGCNSSVAAFETSIADNREAFRRLVPQTPLSVFAYPLDGPVLDIKRAFGRHFVCCRGGGQTFNAGAIDLNLLNAYFLDWRNQDDLAAVQAVIDQNAAERGWLIFATHDVADSPSRYGVSRRFFNQVVAAAVQSGARVVPMMTACRELNISN